MSNAVKTDISRRKSWFVGVPSLAFALSLALAEYCLPRLTADMSLGSRILLRGIMILFGIIGLIQFVSAWLSSRQAIATQIFGKHRMVLPVEGIVYLTIMFVLFIGAMLTKSNMLLLVFALMAGPFVINGWMTFGMLQSARVVRTAPKRAMVGELFGVELALSNSRPLLSIWIMTVRDEIRHRFEELTATVLFARVSPRSSQAGHYQLRLMRRGRFQLGPILASSRFPLGLVERSRLFPIAGEILVYPRIGRLAPSWRNRWLGATEMIARPQPRSGIFHDEFHRLREFRTGDNPRDIHWRSSARRGELILREYQQNRDFNLAVVLDLWQSTTSQKRNPELIEMALSFVATLVVEHGRTCRDAIMTLAAAGKTVMHWEGQGSPASLESLFDGLAVIESGEAANAATLVEEAIQQTSASTQIIFVTTRPIDATSQVPVHNPRVDVIRLAEMDLNSVLIFEDFSDSFAARPTSDQDRKFISNIEV